MALRLGHLPETGKNAISLNRRQAGVKVPGRRLMLRHTAASPFTGRTPRSDFSHLRRSRYNLDMVILILAAFPLLAVSVGYAYGPGILSFSFRFAGRDTRLHLSGYGLALLIMTAGMLFGFCLPSVATNCYGLRHQPRENAQP
jgi:hypothetical protein